MVLTDANNNTQNIFAYDENRSFISHSYGCRDGKKHAEYLNRLKNNKWWISYFNLILP
jgi:hypothetical protein